MIPSVSSFPIPVKVRASAAALLLALIPVSAQETPRRAVPIAPEATESAAPRAEAVESTLKSNPEEDLFTFANLVYDQKSYTIAGQRFEQYLREYPKGANADAAWFRLGECSLNQQFAAAAEAAYLKVVREFPQSSFVASAAYRLGMLAYNRGEFQVAEPYFSLSDAKTTRDSIREAALYYRGRCLKQMGKDAEAKNCYAKVLELGDASKFREVSLLSLARLQAETGDHAAAFESFTTLAKESARPPVQGEALFKAGLLADRLGKPALARESFEQVMSLKGAEEWKSDAQFNLIESAYAAGDHKAVLEAFQHGIVSMPHELRPKLLLMVGNSYRHEERFATAIDIYLNVERYYPNSLEATEAGYRKLLCFYNLKNPNLPDFVDQFVANIEAVDPESDKIDTALLLKAETQFAEGAMGPAAETYDRITLDRLPESLRASALYKKGWAHAEGESAPAAVAALGEFITRYPEDERLPQALAKRGLSAKSVEDLSTADRDFQRILDEFPESETRELAYQQLALIKGQQRDYAAMVAAYQGLLENFPTSAAVPEAWFWIGWGQFELRRFAECVEPLHKSRELDAATFSDRATLRIILAYRSLEDVENARKEIDAALAASGAGAIPPQVYQWLGIRLSEAGDSEGADKYLTLWSTPDVPENTKAVIWQTIGAARLSLKRYETAIMALDFYLATEQPDGSRAKVLNDKAQALLALGKLKEADEVAAEGVQIEREGRVNAQLFLTWGEIAIADKRWSDAVQRLIRPSYVFDDDVITPQALAKSAFAHDQLGEKEKAEDIRVKLRERFPSFKSTDAAANTGS